jgi:hypothetical protein
VIWQPYLLAVVFGVAVSAWIYAAFLWPRVEPEEDGDAGDDGAAAGAAGDGDRSGEGGDVVRATD